MEEQSTLVNMPLYSNIDDKNSRASLEINLSYKSVNNFSLTTMQWSNEQNNFGEVNSIEILSIDQKTRTVI